jgi:hypothetical protein
MNRLTLFLPVGLPVAFGLLSPSAYKIDTVLMHCYIIENT